MSGCFFLNTVYIHISNDYIECFNHWSLNTKLLVGSFNNWPMSSPNLVNSKKRGYKMPPLKNGDKENLANHQLGHGLSDFAKIWYTGALQVGAGRGMVKIYTHY